MALIQADLRKHGKQLRISDVHFVCADDVYGAQTHEWVRLRPLH